MYTFPLIGKKKPISYIIILIIWNLGLLSGFLGILSLFFGADVKLNKLLIVFFISFIIWIIGNLFIKKYTIVGNIDFSSNSIKITKDNNILNINVLKTKNLKLKYFGAKGDSFGTYVGFLRIKDGSGNIISFEYEEVTYKFEFLITKGHFLNSVNWILKAWKDENVDFTILNQNKEDITFKVLSRQGKY